MRKIIVAILMLLPALGVMGAPAPKVYFLPAGNAVFIVLGETPRSVKGFTVQRRDEGERTYKDLVPSPIAALQDPAAAAAAIGPDFPWLAGEVGTNDPATMWNRLRRGSSTTAAYALLSHGLRVALGRTYIDNAVSSGERYRYRVELLDGNGRSIDRVEKNVTVGDAVPPVPPAKVQAEAGDGRVIITWEYATYRGGESDRTVGFAVARKATGEIYRSVTAAPVLRTDGDLQFTDDTIANGISYTYSVAAVDIIGVQSDFVESEAVVPRDAEPPLVPAGLSVADIEEGALLVWKLSPELDAAGYHVYKGFALGEDVEFTRLTNSPLPFDSPRFVDTSARRGLLTFYRVTTLDTADNESEPCGAVSITLQDDEPPPPPRGVLGSADPESRQVTLTWTAPEVVDLLGFYVYRGESGRTTQRMNKDPISADDSMFTDSGFQGRGVIQGREFAYAVTSVDTSLNESEAVEVMITVADIVPPDPPISVRGQSATDGSVLLRWNPRLARDLAAHRIYRKDEKDFALLDEVAKGTNRWTDSSAQRGVEQHYRITAVDESGNESEPTITISVVPTDIIAPGVPRNLEIGLGDKAMRLTWDPPEDEDVDYYLVFRAPYEGARKVQLGATIPGETIFEDKANTTGGVYSVHAVDTSGNQGDAAVSAAPVSGEGR